MYQGSARQNLAAEARAVEEGHHAFVNDDGSIRVKSHTRPGVTYNVRFAAVGPGSSVMFDCNCPAGLHSRICKHTALAARRLEREGLVTWAGGHWYATDKAREAVQETMKDYAPSGDAFTDLDQEGI